MTRRVAALALALLAGCGDQEAARPAEPTTSAHIGIPVEASVESTIRLPDATELDAGDFLALDEMTEVGGLFVDNRLGRLDEAIAVARGEQPRPFPVGTILRVVATEAMVKRAPGFDPDSGDWEFVVLGIAPEGPTIVTRGGAEVTNAAGVTCVSCHSQATADFVCHLDPDCPAIELPPPTD